MSEIEQYDYELPKELIAQQPLACRSDARLMIVRRSENSIEHARVADLPGILASGDTLVLNNTRVIAARLVGRREQTGGRWSGLFLNEDTKTGTWCVLCKTRGKPAPGETVWLENAEAKPVVRLELITKLGGGQWVVRPEAGLTTLEALDMVGRVPLPHYIREGEMLDSDRRTYQTVYAEEPGAVAAPTAGLHFTEGLLESLENKGVLPCSVTLHVGMGTFRPISVENLDQHEMHSEWGTIDADTAECLAHRRAAGGRTIAVGTTSVRVLETAAASGSLDRWSGETDLFIRPGHKFQAIDALMTNFHLPRTTLLVLVRTFGGDALIRRAYEEAIAEQYRFYSYGDSMLIF